MISIFSKFLLICLVPLIFLNPKDVKLHPFHVSTTDINFNSNTKSLEIVSRVFSDDFEMALKNVFQSKIDLQKKDMDILVQKYFEKNFQLFINHKKVIPIYIGFENDHEATNVYLEVPKVSNIKSIKLINTILYESFSDQMNILHINKRGLRQSSRVNFPEKEIILNFK